MKLGSIKFHCTGVLSFMCFQEELYAKICSLSYTGDLRMLFAEDKNKVTMIEALFRNLNAQNSLIS